MTEKWLLRLERAERVDQPDLQHGVAWSIIDALAQLVGELVVGADGAPTQLYGFDVTINGSVITVTRGAAVTGFRIRGELRRGIVLAGGPATRAYDVSTLADGTYGAYVRLAFREAQVRQRRFWNAAGAPPAEVTRLMATRFAEDWDLVLERASPGPEYLQLGTVAITSGVPGLFTSTVSRLFDSARGNRVLTDGDWGGGLDRDETDLAGLRGLTRFTKMVLRQLQDIIGVDFFGNFPQAGTANGSDGPRSLRQLNDEKLARNGAQGMTGNLTVGANLDVSGSATVGNSLQVANDLTVDSDVIVAGGADVGTDLGVGGDVEVDGSVEVQEDVDVVGTVEAAHFVAEDLAPTPPEKGGAYRDTITTVQGYVKTDGGGAFVASPYLVGCSVSLPGSNRIRVTFTLPYVDADSYVVSALARTADVPVYALGVDYIRDATFIDFLFGDPDDVTVDPAAREVWLDFKIAGRQV